MMQKRAYLTSILLTILILVFPVMSGVIIVTQQLEGSDASFVQGIFFIIGGIIGVLIAKYLFKDLDQIGLAEPLPSEYSYLLPLMVVESVPLFMGVQSGLTLLDLGKFLVFALAVGFTEELYFRGMIFNLLRPKGLKTATVVTTLLFSAGHILNLLGGADLVMTLFQLVLAFAFSLITIMIFLDSKSLLIPIIFHAVHNFIVRITLEGSMEMNLLLGGVQVVVYLLIANHLWQRNRQTAETDQLAF